MSQNTTANDGSKNAKNQTGKKTKCLWDEEHSSQVSRANVPNFRMTLVIVVIVAVRKAILPNEFYSVLLVVFQDFGKLVGHGNLANRSLVALLSRQA
jgi:hypothetical protein